MPEGRAGRVNILVVDDDNILRDIYVSALRRAGYGAEGASDGKEALKMLGGAAFSMVLTDINMPVLDGIGLYSSVLAEYPCLKDRFLFMTGDSSFDEGRLPGGDRRILKPFGITELLDAVGRMALRSG